MKKFEEFTNWYGIDDKLKVLKSYINILKNYKDSNIVLLLITL